MLVLICGYQLHSKKPFQTAEHQFIINPHTLPVYTEATICSSVFASAQMVVFTGVISILTFTFNKLYSVFDATEI